ncbi:MAG: CheB methylesterase domain-containing protein [Desulfovibrionales bacterium]|nr:CheB methylesterase domain-containing protein [Desulfovibrionales bacterium]
MPPSIKSRDIIALGASTGGVDAIQRVLTTFPADGPAILIVQHMPPKFTHRFAQRLDRLCKLTVREAVDGEPLAPGLALLAPGNFHMTLQPKGDRYQVRTNQAPMVHHQRPAVDVLFKSVARHAGARSMGILLTGMGMDGARGMVAMKAAGAFTIAQDEASSVVYGMPREAVNAGAVDLSLNIDRIGQAALAHLHH